jgi:uncharacterized protein YcfJ
MKKLLVVFLVSMASSVFAQEVRYANIVSVTPLTDQVSVIKSNCVDAQQERSFWGMIFGGLGGAAVGKAVTKSNTGMAVGAAVGGYAGDAIETAMNTQERCRQIHSYEPVSGGYQIVYELDGQQYTVRSNTFPRGKTIPVHFQPVPTIN